MNALLILAIITGSMISLLFFIYYLIKKDHKKNIRKLETVRSLNKQQDKHLQREETKEQDPDFESEEKLESEGYPSSAIQDEEDIEDD